MPDDNAHPPAPDAVPDPEPGPRQTRPSRVLDSIARMAGDAPRVLLREDGTEDAPLVSPVPIGRADRGGDDRYQILGEIARGGVGVILKGQDLDLGRDVAMKVLREEHADNASILQRFVEEAQVGGQLQHPGIVPVYELGQREDQRPYFTMKLVKGRTLGTLLAERNDSGQDRRRLLSIFEQMCQTMSYAHSRGVIHRDLKPANVMVGAFGEVQVVDWGLAKVLAQGGVADERKQKEFEVTASIVETVRNKPGSTGSDSVMGSIMGTPAYMPPEQARGQVDRLDERTDVFSLGAILCEILTGRPPYVGDSSEVIVSAADGRLEPAYQALDEVGTDRELIDIAKSCLHAARSERPRDASEVTERVTGYLSSVDERARVAQIAAAEARVKAANERRARRMTLALAIAVLAVLGLGGGGAFVLDQQHRTTLSNNKASVQSLLERARHLEGIATTAGLDLAKWDEALQVVANAETVIEIKQVDEDTRRRVADLREDLESKRRLASFEISEREDDQSMLQRFEELQVAPGTAPSRTQFWEDLDARYEDTFLAYGVDLSNPEEAAALLRDSAMAVSLAASLDLWAETRRRVEGRESESAREMVNLAIVADPDPWRRHLRTVALTRDLSSLERLATSPEVSRFSAATLNALGSALVDLGAVDLAIQVMEDGARRFPDDYALHLNLAFILRQWARDRPTESLRYAAVACSLRPDSADALHALAYAQALLGDHENAVGSWARAIELQPDSALLYGQRVESLLRLGQLSAAVESAQQAVNLEPENPRHHLQLGTALINAGEQESGLAALQEAVNLDQTGGHQTRLTLGLAFMNAGLWREALPPLEEALVRSSQAMPVRQALSKTYVVKSRSPFSLGDSELRVRDLQEALRHDPDNLEAMASLATLLGQTGDIPGSMRVSRQVLAVLPDHFETHALMGEVLTSQRRYTEAEFHLRVALRVGVGLDRLHPVALARQYHRLGLCLWLEEKLDESREVLLQGLSIVELPEILRDLAWVEFDAGNLDTAIEWLNTCLQKDPKQTLAAQRLGIAWMRKGDPSRGIEAIERAVEVDPGNPDLQITLGDLREGSGDVDGWKEAYREAARLRLEQRRANLAGSVYLAVGDLDDAEQALRQFLADQPEDAQARVWLGRTLLEQGRDQQAIDEMHQVLARSENTTGAHEVILDATRNLAEGPRSVVLEDCVARYLHFPLYRYGLAHHLATSEAGRDLPRALEMAQTLVAGVPEDPLVWHLMGTVQLNAGDAEAAARSYERALELKPRPTVGDLAGLAQAYTAQGRMEVGRYWFEKAVAMAESGQVPPHVRDALEEMRAVMDS